MIDLKETQEIKVGFNGKVSDTFKEKLKAFIVLQKLKSFVYNQDVDLSMKLKADISDSAKALGCELKKSEKDDLWNLFKIELYLRSRFQIENYQSSALNGVKIDSNFKGQKKRQVEAIDQFKESLSQQISHQPFFL